MSDAKTERQSAQSELLDGAACAADHVGSNDDHDEVMAAIVMACAALGQFELAELRAGTISDPIQHDASVGEIGIALARAGRLDDGLNLIDSVQDVSAQSLALGRVVLAVADQGELETALAVAEDLADSSATIGELAIRFADTGDFVRAEQLLEKIEFEGSRVWVLCELARRFGTQGASAQALDVLQRAEAEAQDIEFAEERVSALVEIGTAFHTLDQPTETQRLFAEASGLTQDIDGELFHDTALAQLALAHARTGNIEQARATIEQIEDPFQASGALTDLAQEVGRQGDRELAHSILTEALGVVDAIDVYEERSVSMKDLLHSKIAARYFDLGDVERAHKTLSGIAQEAAAQGARTELALYAVTAGDTAFGFKLAAEIGQPHAALVCYLLIYDLCAKSDPDNSALALNKARTQAEAIEFAHEKVHALTELGRRTGDRTTLRAALSLISTLASEFRQARALCNLSFAYGPLEVELDADEQALLQGIVRELEG